jgi:uncharacterized protein (TIGR03437 family)
LATTQQQAPGSPFPVALEGTQVMVMDSAGVSRPAPLCYVSLAQVDYEVPAGTALGPASVTVTSGDGTVTSGSVTIAAIAPGLFTANSNGQGVAAAILVVSHADGTEDATPVFTCGPIAGSCVAVPVNLGASADQAVLQLYGTGIRGRSALANVTCGIGGLAVPVLYAGAQGTNEGEDEVDVSLPFSLAGAGPVNILLTVNGVAANTVTMELQ